MEFRDILVHMDATNQCDTRLNLAVGLASKHGATLTGLYPVTHQHYAPQGESIDLKMQQARERFESLTAASGIESEFVCADWAVSGDRMADMISYYSHTRDLVIVGQTDHARPSGEAPADLPERVVLGAGRPVLVVPFAGTFKTVGQRVVIAWRTGQASARAVHDALPFLLAAEEVFVVTVSSSDDTYHPGAEESSILSHLARYGIVVREMALEIGDVPVDSVLMNFAWEHGCDLLVMGVSAHTVRGTLTIGPVARQVFQQMTLPVLMSH